MPGLWGGYSRDLRRIFLSADCPEDLQTAVLLEEIGHFLDQELCTEETPGEEGAHFAAVVLGSPCRDYFEDETLRPIYFNGKPLLVEAAPKVRGSAKTTATPTPKVRGKVGSTPVPDTSISQDGNVVYANKDSVRITQTKAGQRVIGSKGNDTFVVSSQDVRLEDPNGGTDTVEAKVSFSLANFSFIENLTAVSGTSAISLTGNSKANVITGNSGNNVLDGGVDSQKDTLIGGAGNDTYIIRDSLDVVTDSAGTDVIFTTNQSLSLSSYTNIEHICFIGTDGADSMFGGAGAGTLIGGKGNDTYFVDHVGDAVSETDASTLTGGVDWVNARISHSLGSNVENIIKSGNANASLTGTGLANIIDGSAGGINTISGGQGNDTLIVHGRRIGNIDGGVADTDWLRLTGDLLAYRNPSFTDIEVLDLSLLSGSASVTLNPAASGLETLIASSFNDTIDAAAFSSAITIDASASSGARLIGSISNTNQNTLIGGSAGGNEFVLGSISTNSLVGGANGLDTLTLKNGGILADSDFATVSYIGTLKFEGSSPNTVSLGSNALIAGIRTLVGGEGDDDGTGNTFDTSAYGSSGVLFQITDQDYLTNITTMVGGSGVDTLKFSRDGVSVTDENVASLFNIDVLQMAGGTNRFLLHDDFVGKGIETMIGGTGLNIIEMNANLYSPASDADIIAMDMSFGTRYTLNVDDTIVEFARVIGGANGGSVSITETNGTVQDADLANLYAANIHRLVYSGDITLAGNAEASGVDILDLPGGGTADVSDFHKELTINGGLLNGIEMDAGITTTLWVSITGEKVRTSFAALADLTFNGIEGTDTLQIIDSEARAITSLKGNFEVLELGGGNNYFKLADDAGLQSVIGGGGADTLDFSDNTTGINFVMDSNVLGTIVNGATIKGGSGVDTITVNFTSPISGLPTTGNTFNDTQLTRVRLSGAIEDTLNGFSTDADGGNTYNFATQFNNNGISRIYAHASDVINTTAVAGRDITFVFQDEADIQSSKITARSGVVPINTIQLITPDNLSGDISLTNAHFANHSNIDAFLFTPLNTGSHTNLDLTIGPSPISSITGGNGMDTINASAMITAVTLSGGINAQFGSDKGTNPLFFDVNNDNRPKLIDALIGGSGADSLYGDNFYDSLVGNNGNDTLCGTSSTARGANEIDTLTGGVAGVGDVGNDLFILGDSSNAYYNTAALGGDYAIITDFTAGDIIQLKDLTSQFGTATDAPAQNVGGYVFGNARYGVTGSGTFNSYLFVDNDKNGSESQGDNLIAVIQSAALGTFTTSDLEDNLRFKFV